MSHQPERNWNWNVNENDGSKTRDNAACDNFIPGVRLKLIFASFAPNLEREAYFKKKFWKYYILDVRML